MEIFDAHTHFFGRDYYEFQTIRQPDGTAEILPKQMGGAADGVLLRRLLAGMNACGILRAVTYASISNEMETVGEAALASQGRLVPFASVNPLSSDSMQTLERLQPKYAFRGMVLHPATHDYPVGCEAAGKALDFARANEMVILVHFGLLRLEVRRLIGLAPIVQSDHSHPADLVPVAGDRPDQCFIVSHTGSETFGELLELGASRNNVYADTAGCERWTDWSGKPTALAGRFGELYRSYGAGRIVFGSDSGETTWAQHRSTVDSQVSAMRDSGYNEDDIAAVLSGNLSKLLRSN